MRHTFDQHLLAVAHIGAVIILLHLQSFSLAGEPQTVTLRVEVPLVTVGVRVTDEKGREIQGLRAGDMDLYEDGVRQQISFFARDEQPMSLGILLDCSDSMSFGDKFELAKTAAQLLIDSAPAGSDYLYLPFSRSWPSRTRFTNDRAEVMRSLAATQLETRTKLYDAILAALVHCRTAKHGRQAVVVITDGADTDSLHRLDDVVRALRESQVQLFMIGYFSARERDMFFKRDKRGKLMPGEYLQSVFVRLARESGGTSFFPESDQELQLAADQISRDLRTQYSLGYCPSNAMPDDHYRRIEVRLRKPAGFIVRARQGYI